MIPDSIKINFTGLLANNLSTDEIDSLGKKLEPKFNSHILSGQPFGITLRPEQAAQILLERFSSQIPKIIAMLINMVEHEDTSILGRIIPIQGMDVFMQKLGSAGWKYDIVSGTLQKSEPEEETADWGIMREGNVYQFAYLSVDIAGNSQIQLKYPRSEIETVYENLLGLINETVKKYSGRIWSWAGDGGLVSFYLGDCSQEAVKCAIEIQLRMIQFNLDVTKNSFREPVHLRIAAHEGETVYRENKGAILSEAINYVAHLEKKGTESDSVSISENVRRALPARLKGVFEPRGEFENINHYSLSFKMPFSEFKD